MSAEMLKKVEPMAELENNPEKFPKTNFNMSGEPQQNNNNNNNNNNNTDINLDPLLTKSKNYGPFIKYISTQNNTWTGTVLFISSSNDTTTPPVLTINNLTQVEQPQINITAKLLPVAKTTSVVKDQSFWKFEINIPQDPNITLKYEYYINGASKAFNFYVAGASEEYWNWMFYSCNGLSLSVTDDEKKELQGLQPLWKDFLGKHKETPFHTMLGGGDQVYADEMWSACPGLVSWLNIKGKDARFAFEWNNDLEQELNLFYFELYLKEWSDPYVAEALASIPQLNIMDDHDLWDGFGSYPEFLSQSNVFKNCARISLFWFAVFQLHTTPELSRHDGYFGANGSFNHIRMFGPKTAILMVDARTERRLDQVVSPESWSMIKGELEKLPSTTKHMILATGVPIIHPRLDFADFANSSFGVIKKCFNGIANKLQCCCPCFKGAIKSAKVGLGKTGLFKRLINVFGLPELSDDLADHWTAKDHTEERKAMIQMLQNVSQEYKYRVTLIGGDVHCCLSGRFYDKAQPDGRGFRLMYQFTSSAIGNVPPPPAVIGQINGSGSQEHNLDENTVEQQLMLFKTDVDGKTLDAYSLGRRNYLTCTPAQGDSLRISIVVESDKRENAAVEYPTVVPPYA